MNKLLILMISVIFTQCGQAPLSTLSGLEDKNRLNIVVLGDSISTGVFADTSIGEFPSEYLGDAFGVTFQNPKDLIMDFDNWLDDLGKRINQESYRTHLTAFGSIEPWGIRHQLAKKHGLDDAQEVGYHSMAEFGKKTKHLKDQIQKFQKTEQEPSHGFVVIGSNDFCSKTPIEDFEKNMDESMALFKKKYPNTKMYLGSLPPIEELPLNKNTDDYHYFRTKVPTGKFTTKMKKKTVEKWGVKIQIPDSIPEIIPEMRKVGLSCKDFRKSYCPSMYDRDAGARVQQYNQAIKKTAKKNGYTYVNDVSKLGTDKSDFGFDCFHPSAEAQQNISQIFWQHLKK